MDARFDYRFLPRRREWREYLLAFSPYHPFTPYHRFKSQDPNALVQTGPRLLTVNILPVYPSFEVFRELILYTLKHYREVAEPGNLTRVGLSLYPPARNAAG